MIEIVTSLKSFHIKTKITVLNSNESNLKKKKDENKHKSYGYQITFELYFRLIVTEAQGNVNAVELV